MPSFAVSFDHPDVNRDLCADTFNAGAELYGTPPEVSIAEFDGDASFRFDVEDEAFDKDHLSDVLANGAEYYGPDFTGFSVTSVGDTTTDFTGSSVTSVDDTTTPVGDAVPADSAVVLGELEDEASTSSEETSVEGAKSRGESGLHPSVARLSRGVRRASGRSSRSSRHSSANAAPPTSSDSAEGDAAVEEEPEIIKEYLTYRQSGGKIHFAADEESGSVVVTLRDGDEEFPVKIPAEQLVNAFVGLFEQGSVRFHADQQDLVLRILDMDERGKVSVVFLRTDNPLVIRRAITVDEVSLAYGIGIGVITGNYLAKPAKRRSKRREER